MPALCLLGATGISYAAPARPGLIDFVQPDGSVIKIEIRGNFANRAVYSEEGVLLEATPEGGYRPAPNLPMTLSASSAPVKKGPGLCKKAFPSKGEQKVLVILVETDDCTFSLENPYGYFHDMLNQEGYAGYGATGSARDYFVENSCGLFQPEFDVYGPVRLPRSMDVYGKDTGGYEQETYLAVTDAAAILDDEVDFSQYDRDGDGEVDNVYLFYAGYGQNDTGRVNTIWPHSADIEFFTTKVYECDGVRFNHYACSQEQPFEQDHPAGIGTFIHEFSHVMGLPDLYSTVYNFAFTPGDWSALDSGPYNNEGRTPPNYSAFERYALDWLEPKEISLSGEYFLSPIADSNEAYIVRTDREEEYFLLEYRSLAGWDEFLPNSGMLVWHIDYDETAWEENTVNNDRKHQRVDLVEADGSLSAYTRAGDSFPGYDCITSFGRETVPAFTSHKGVWTGVDLTDITENGLPSSGLSFVAEVEGSGVSVSEMENDLSVQGLTVSSSQPFSVYDLQGHCLGRDLTTYTAPLSGLYLISLPDSTRKLLLR